MEGTPELDLLELFVAVAQASSFSVAAERLGRPKSSVSRGIARLEKGLRTQLLQRTTHAVGLTTAGAALLERVAPLVLSLRQATGSLPDLAEVPAGQVRVTAAAGPAAAALGELVARFTLRYPAVRVEARLTNDALDLVAEGIDVAIRSTAGRLADSTLIVRKLGSAEAHLFAAPSYLARRGTPRTLEDLAGHDEVVFRGWRRGKQREAGARVVGDDLSFVVEAIRGGAGIGVLPTMAAQAGLADGTLVRVLPRYVEGTGTLYLVSPRMEHVPARVRAFRELAIEEFRRVLPP
jgi:DNA-binding transcriptional LysR family regulator